jgi:hypothetical protein
VTDHSHSGARRRRAETPASATQCSSSQSGADRAEMRAYLRFPGLAVTAVTVGAFYG